MLCIIWVASKCLNLHIEHIFRLISEVCQLYSLWLYQRATKYLFVVSLKPILMFWGCEKILHGPDLILFLFQVQGAIAVASLFEVVVGFCGVLGLLLQYIGPLAIAPTISLIGISLFRPAAAFCATQWWIAILYVPHVLHKFMIKLGEHIQFYCWLLIDQ